MFLSWHNPRSAVDVSVNWLHTWFSLFGSLCVGNKIYWYDQQKLLSYIIAFLSRLKLNIFQNVIKTQSYGQKQELEKLTTDKKRMPSNKRKAKSLIVIGEKMMSGFLLCHGTTFFWILVFRSKKTSVEKTPRSSFQNTE